MHFKLGLYEHQSAGAIQAVVDLLAATPAAVVEPDRIREIRVRIYEPAYSIIADPAKRTPTTRQSADHSLPYILARTLLKARDAARAAAGKIAVDRDQPLADRRLAVRLLGQAARGTGAGGGAARAVLDAFIGAHEPAELQAEAVAAVVRSGVAESIAGVVAALSSLEPAVRAAAVTALLDRRDATPALLAAIERREVSPAIVPLERRAALEKSSAEAIRAAAARIWPAGTAGLSAAELESLVAAVRRGGSVDRGREVFTRHCAACHQVAGAGRQVGPDLAEAADRPIERLVSDIVDPNRSVEPRWEATLIVTTTGDPLEGILVASGRESVVLVRAGGDRITVPREDIEALRAGGRSLMPEGFGRQVPPGDFADLVAFLRGGRPVPVLVRK